MSSLPFHCPWCWQAPSQPGPWLSGFTNSFLLYYLSLDKLIISKY